MEKIEYQVTFWDGSTTTWSPIPKEPPFLLLPTSPATPQNCKVAKIEFREAAGDRPTEEWWTADHYKSDSYYHVYCGSCYRQVPDFLIRWSSKMAPPYISGGEPACCEACQKEATQ